MTSSGGGDLDRGAPPILVLALYTLLIAGIAALITGAYLGARSTLHRIGGWRSGKLELERPVIGGAATVVTRRTLHRGRLDLGAYHGFQEFLTEKQRPVAALEVTFRIPRRGYLDILFGPGDGNLSGIRLSRHPSFRDLYYDVDQGGRFVRRRILPPIGEALGGGWSTVRLGFDEGRVSVLVGGADPLDLAAGQREIHVVGFRGGEDSVLVDDVVLSFPGGERWSESFSLRRGFGGIFAVVAVALVVLTVAGYAFARRGRAMKRREAHVAVLAGLIVLSVAVAGYAAVDHFYLGSLYPEPSRIDYGDLEFPRDPAATDTARFSGLAAASPGELRVLLLGSSQTWGAGALRAEDAIDRVLARRLAARFPGRSIRVLDGGVSGSNSREVLGLYRGEWSRLDPDVVVVDLSHNDPVDGRLRENLEEMAAINAERGIAGLFVLEPNSTEITDRIRAKHAQVREAARATGTPLLDMQEYLESRREDGFVWWDRVHLTSFGQELFAERLLPEIVRLAEATPRLQGAGAGAAAAASPPDSR